MFFKFLLTSKFAGEVETPREIFSWGNNSISLLGLGDSEHRSSATQIGTNRWRDVSVGKSTTAAIDVNYQIFQWGKQIAYDDPQEVYTDSTVLSEPTLVNSIGNEGQRWKQVAVGLSHIYAIEFGSNKLWAIGNNSINQLSIDNTPNTFSWTQVSAGRSHSVGIRADGILYTWGSGNAGELGNIAAVDRSALTVAHRLYSWTQISGGDQFTLAIRTDGSLWGWGKNTHGQVGDLSTEWRSSPVQIAEGSSWSKISTGRSHSVGIKTDGTIWSWGINTSGQLGQINRIHRSSPIQIGTQSWSYVGVGQNHNLAIRADGTLYSWGVNNAGQLGDGTLLTKSSPVQIGTDSWTIVAGGFNHSSGINVDGILHTWGSNDSGQLGNNTIVNQFTPTALADSWVSVDAGDSHTVALKDNYTAWAWGFNSFGQLGVNDTAHRSSPVQVNGGGSWNQISAGANHTLAISNTDLRLFTWGLNDIGQLADATTTNRTSPRTSVYTSLASFRQVGTDTWEKIYVKDNYAVGINTAGELQTFGIQNPIYQGAYATANPYFYKINYAADSWSQVATGRSHTLAIKPDGTLWAWGTNTYGELGQGTFDDGRSSPVQIGSANNWTDATVYDDRSAAIKDDGSLWVWGNNLDNLLGYDDSTSWSLYETNQYSPHWVSVAIRSNGDLYMWGSNNLGQLGLGDVVHRSTPVLVGRDYAYASCNWEHTLAIKTDGTLWAWGQNSLGQLGIGTITAPNNNVSSPIQVGALSDWSVVDAGKSHSLAIKSDGTMWAWGSNQYGQVGDNALNVHKSSPVQIGASQAASWIVLNAGYNHNHAIASDNAVYSWGFNEWGQLGHPDRTHRYSPVRVGTSSWTSVAGGYHFLGVTTAGTVFAQGYNALGSVGDGTTTGRSALVQLFTGIPGLTGAIAGSSTHDSSLLTANGTLYTWGSNNQAQLGNNTVANILSPVQIGALGEWAYSNNSNKKSNPGGALRKVTSTAGTFTDVWAWGPHNNFVAGDNINNTLKSSPIQVPSLAPQSYKSQSFPVQLGLDSWTQVDANHDAVMAIRNDGAMFTWGKNSTFGNLGLGDTLHRSSPTQIGSDSWTQVRVGRDHSAAIRNDGGLFTWGLNGQGQLGILGIGTTEHRVSPNQLGIDSWIQITSRYGHTAGIKDDYSLWVWGLGTSGQLGQNNILSMSSPVQIAGSWSQVSLQGSGTLALNMNGTIWSWGRNTNGELGHNNRTHRSSPVQIGALSDWTTISTNTNSGFALNSSNLLYSWGFNSNGQLGQNNTTHRSAPIQVSTLLNTSWSQITSGDAHTIALDMNDEVWGWGLNTSGQVGDGTASNKTAPIALRPGKSWSSIYAGGNQSFAIDPDYKLFAWGLGTSGQLGWSTGQTTNFSTFTVLGPPLEQQSWAKVTAGFSHTLAIQPDGTLWGWGLNNAGQLGTGNVISRSSPIQISSDTDWENVYAGLSFSAATKTDGTLWTWGLGTSGQLGHGNALSLSSPVQLGVDTDWAQVVLNGTGVFTRKTNGSLWNWGLNTNGELGNGTVAFVSSPTQIASDYSWTQIAGGIFHNLAIRSDGLLFSWGGNTLGQLADRTQFGVPTSKTVPTRVEYAESGVRLSWSQISAGSGGTHTLALRSDGILYAWGLGTSGQIGDGTASSKSSPIQIGSESWKTISAGNAHNLAIRQDDTLWAWGNNGTGRLGNGNALNQSSPVQIASGTSWKVAKAGLDYSMAIDSLNQLWAWGAATNGKLGITKYPATVTHSFPVHIDINQPLSWSTISTGSVHSVAIKPDGTLWAWGTNTNGQLGQGNRTHRNSPTQIGSATTWIEAYAGNATTFARNNIGQIFSCGSNGSGELGHNNLIARSTLVQIGALGWNSIGVSGTGNHTLAIRSDGILFAWGLGTSGQLGGGNVLSRSSPIQIGSETWEKVIAGQGHTLAIRSDITLWSWGRNTEGQLGDDTIISKSSPIQIGAFGDWTQIAAGRSHSVAIRETGGMYAWGRNTEGQLGLDDTAHRSSPVQIGSDSWTQVAAGYTHTTALRADGTIWGWGAGNGWQLGLGDQNHRSSPVQISANSDWTSIATAGNHSGAINDNYHLFMWGTATDGRLGTLFYPSLVNITTGPELLTEITAYKDVDLFDQHTVALRYDNTLWAWGLGTSGQLGDGTVISRSSPIQIGSESDWVEISVGTTHSAARRESNTLFVWGLGTSGQIGDNTALSKSSPVQIDGSWVSVDAGLNFTLAISSNNELFGWGAGLNSMTGQGNVINTSSPVQLSTGNSTPVSWTFVATGSQHAGAITDGTLWLWGNGTNGAIAPSGDGVLFARSSPTQVGFESWTQVIAGGNSTFAKRLDEKFYAWGSNGSGQLGQGNIISKSSPVQLSSVNDYQEQFFNVGTNHTTARKSDGTIWSWGNNGFGQLAQGDQIHRSSPTQIGDQSWKWISSSGDYTMAIDANNYMYGSGQGTNGQHGILSITGSAGNAFSPSQVGLSSWIFVSTTDTLTYAIKPDNSLWGWGNNTLSRLTQDGSVVNYSSPIQIGSDSWSQMAAGVSASGGLTSSNNHLFMWGRGTNGQLHYPRATTQTRSSPTQVGGESGYIYESWSQVATDSLHTLAIRSDGTAWAWGWNLYGQLGVNDRTHRSSPVQIGSANTWTQIDNGNANFSVGIQGDGLYAWGRNNRYQIGDGTTENRSSPVLIETGFTNGKIDAGFDYTGAINTNNLLYFWGNGD